MPVLSDDWFAWISGLLGLALGVGTYGILGFEPLGYGYVALTLVMVWRLVPDGDLNARLRIGRRD